MCKYVQKNEQIVVCVSNLFNTKANVRSNLATCLVAICCIFSCLSHIEKKLLSIPSDQQLTG